MAPVAAATFTLLAAFCIFVYLCVFTYIYYFYALKERERLTCVRVDWVYSCDVSSREKEETKEDD